MRKIDKLKNIQRANLLSEQRYLQTKGFFINEEENLLSEERISMAEFLGETTDNPETLLKMFSKYQPNESWFMTVGYTNNVKTNVTIKNEDMSTLEDIARKLGNRAFTDMVNSEEWKTAKDSGKTFKNPFAARTVKGESIPSKIYSIKSFTIQWGNIKNKADKDADVKKAYDKYGIEWSDGGKIDPNDPRGQGWENIEGTPFQQHQNTGTKRLAIYNKREGVKKGKTKYFLNYQDDIAELTPDEVNYIFSLAPTSTETKMPKRLLDMENQEAAQEIFAIENAYEFKNLNLEKITYIQCSMKVGDKNLKFSYVNKNAAPDGLNSGEFAQFINPS
jgi:hypothetical protein